MAYDPHEVNEGLYTLLNVTALHSLIGNPIRLHPTFPPKPVKFPWVRLDMIPAAPRAARMGAGGGGVEWIDAHVVQFTVFSKKLSLSEVGPILKAIQTIMDKAPDNLVVTGLSFSESTRGLSVADVDMETGGAFAATEYTLSVDSS